MKPEGWGEKYMFLQEHLDILLYKSVFGFPILDSYI